MISPERPGRGGASYTPLACTWHASEQVLSNCALRSPDRNTPTAWAAAAPRAVCAPAPAGFAAASTCLCQPSTSAARYKWCVYKAGMVRQRNCGSRVKTVPKTGRPHPTKKGAGMGEHSEQNCWRADGNREQTNKQGMARQARRPCRGGQQGGSRTALGFYSGCVCIQYWTWVAAGTAAGPSKRSFPDRRAAPAAAAEQPPRA